MDEQVKAAMARWPNVPAMYGWLRLDRRGKWYLIDRGNPGFDEQRDALGSSITSPSIVDFIARNYQADAQGRWYWQNGPQQVFVDLDLAPLIFRVFENPTGPAAPGEPGVHQSLVSHCGDIVSRIDAIAHTPDGELWLQTDLGSGVIHDLDLAQLDISEREAPLMAAEGTKLATEVLKPENEVAGMETGLLQLQFGDARYPIKLLESNDVLQWGGFDRKPRAG